MRILITGGKGMLGRTLLRDWQALHTCQIADLPETDLTQIEAVNACFEAFKPEVVIHCAAMTQVDACEHHPEKAFRLNEQLTANVAKACARTKARLIAISTDYVFSGKATEPWKETDTPCPKTVYGASKLAGEKAVQTYCPNHLILRVAWLYGAGGPSFVHTMLALAAADPSRTLTVVNDQYGNPTSAEAVSRVLSAFLTRPELRGIFHVTCEGIASWYDFAKTIFRLAGYTSLIVEPCTSEAFPRPAKRPAWSALSKQKLKQCRLPVMPPWQEALARFIRSEWPS